MEYLVNISKRCAFWSLNEDILKINDSEYQYAVSIKEDTAYPCLHSPKTMKETSSIRRIQRRPIRRIEDMVCEDSGRYQAWSLLQETHNTPYPIPWKELQEVMAEPIFDDMEKAPTESNLSITSNNINIELSKEFLVELRKNIYHETYNEDVVDHIAKVIEMVDLIYIPGMDFHQLRMKVFPLSLADDAKEWWISEGDGKITTWEELVEKFFCRFYPESYDGEDEMLDERDN
ncbi:hypothetical protein Tco_1312383 [Tanacetum coccineum]